MRPCLLPILSVALAACSDDAAHPAVSRTGPVWFVDEGLERGVDFTHRSGHEERFLFPELMGGRRRPVRQGWGR